VDPYPRTPVGVAPDLPDRVTLVRGDGTTSRERVTWSRITRDLIESDRPYQVRGTAKGHRVTAHVTPYRVSSVQAFTTTVPVGVRPSLPGTARVTFTDGVTDLAAVTWDPVHAESLTRPGSFTVRGTLAELRLTTSLAATVSSDWTPGQNLAPAAAPSASFSGTPQTVPAALNNGIQPETNGWSNRYIKAATALLPSYTLARPSDWVSLTWDTPQAVDTLVPYFVLAAGRALPAAVTVEYWDGTRFVPAAHQTTTMATESEQPTTVTFDKVSTTAIRLVITSAAPGTPDGFAQVSELRALGDVPSA